MHATIATDAAPGHINEDFAAASTSTAVLLDGAGLSGANDGGCIHGVAGTYANSAARSCTR